MTYGRDGGKSHSDTMRVSLQLSRFYLSHAWLFRHFLSFRQRLPDAMGDQRSFLILAADKRQWKVGCGHDACCRPWPTRTVPCREQLPVRLDKPVFRQGVKQDRDVADVVYRMQKPSRQANNASMSSMRRVETGKQMMRRWREA